MLIFKIHIVVRLEYVRKNIFRIPQPAVSTKKKQCRLIVDFDRDKARSCCVARFDLNLNLQNF